MTAVVVVALFELLAQAHVEVEERRIRLSEQVRFDHKSAKINKASFKVLDELARTLREKTEIELLRIEGHNDSLGVASKAMAMSEARVKAVKRYLVSKGIAEGRLLVRAYGQEWPVASNWIPAGRKLNRRVEFVLVKVQGREVGRRDIPKAYARVLAVRGTADVAPLSAPADNLDARRRLRHGAAVMSGDRVIVDAGGEATVVFPKLNVAQLFGPAEVEVAKADEWSAEKPVQITLKSGRLRVVTTSDSSREVALQIVGANATCKLECGEPAARGPAEAGPKPEGKGAACASYASEMVVTERPGATEVSVSSGTVRCGDTSVTAPGIRFTSDSKKPLAPAGAVTGLSPSTGDFVGEAKLTWDKPDGERSSRVEVSRDTTFVAPIQVALTDSVQASATLAPGRYFWRVIAIGKGGDWSAPSKIMSFTVKAATP